MSKAPELDDALQRVFKAPRLLRINGTGITLRGEFLDSRVFPAFYAIEIFTFFGFLLLPDAFFWFRARAQDSSFTRRYGRRISEQSMAGGATSSCFGLPR
jgi:hypothetical protein